MENKCKCPNCKKDDIVYPSKIYDYVCLRCCCMFDSKEKKHDSKATDK